MEAFINQFGYLAVASLIFLETVFPSIPSEVILPLAGFLTILSAMALPGVIVAATAGAVAWNKLFCSLSAAAGSAWQQVSDQIAWVSDIVTYVLAVLLVAAAAWWVVRRALPVWREGRDERDSRPAA